jgi:hypothetical protein
VQAAAPLLGVAALIELPTDFVSQAAKFPFCLGISDELSRTGKWLKNQQLAGDDLDVLYLSESRTAAARSARLCGGTTRWSWPKA